MDKVSRLIVLLVITGVFFETHGQSQDMFRVAGFATVNGTTTGGEGGDTVTVTTGNELQEAIDAKKDFQSPRVIIVSGIINPDNSEGLDKIDVKDVQNLTIIGAGEGAEFVGIGLKLRRAYNIILRNLKVHHVLSGEKDCIGIEGPADHIWVDHCELYNEFDGVDKDYYDGLLDTKADCEYLTYSWNFLHDSWKTMLVGSSEGDTHDRKLTLHHNYFLNCNSRIPLFRGGTGHFFNNYFVDIASTAVNSRINACVRIENNYFLNTRNPWVTAYSDIFGAGEVVGNITDNCVFEYSEDTHELPQCTAEIPYEYASILHEAGEVPDLVMAYAGTGELHVSTERDRLHRSGNGEVLLEISPNPVSYRALFTCSLPGKGPFNIHLISITGTRYLIQKGNTPDNSITEIWADLSAYPPGIYLVELESKGTRSCAVLTIIRS